MKIFPPIFVKALFIFLQKLLTLLLIYEKRKKKKPFKNWALHKLRRKKKRKKMGEEESKREGEREGEGERGWKRKEYNNNI